MTIKVGDKLPEGAFTIMGESGHEALDTGALLEGKKVVLFAVPGAFTPACNDTHLPGFVVNFDAIKAQAAKDGTSVISSPNDTPSSGASAASAAATALVFINSDAGEGYITVRPSSLSSPRLLSSQAH